MMERLMMEFDIDDILNTSLTTERRDRVPGAFWASEVGKCPRNLYYSFAEKRSPTTENLRIFKVGTLFHEHIQNLIKDLEGTAFKSVVNEKYIMVTDMETDLNITGQADIYITAFPPDSSFVVELKSEKNIYYRNSPSTHHVSQLMIYLRALRIDHGYIIYIQKDNLQTKTFRVDYDKDLFNGIMSKMRSLYKSMLDMELPAKSAEAWECKFCPYKPLCEKDYNPARPSSPSIRKPKPPAEQPNDSIMIRGRDVSKLDE